MPCRSCDRHTGTLPGRVRKARIAVQNCREVGNVLAQAERLRRLTVADTAVFLDLIAALPIAVDDHGSTESLREVLSLARAEGLTRYDAAYLELAIRTGLPLASKDTALREAARRCGVDAVPE